MTSGIIPEEFSELTSLVGYAVWQIQVLEQVLASYLIMVHQITTATARTEVETMFLKTANILWDSFSALFAKPAGGQNRCYRGWSGSSLSATGWCIGVATRIAVTYILPRNEQPCVKGFVRLPMKLCW